MVGRAPWGEDRWRQDLCGVNLAMQEDGSEMQRAGRRIGAGPPSFYA